MAKARPITGLDAHAPVGRNARIIARARLDEMYEWERYVNNSYHIQELHNLRIAAKRLRYTLEIFADVLPGASQPIVKQLEMIQEELGALHDSDVMIALLRLCMSGQDSGTAYEHALLGAKKQPGRFVLPPELVADVVDPAVAPAAEERYGLEQLLLKRQRSRKEQYDSFRQHWLRLQEQDFQREVLDMLDISGA